MNSQLIKRSILATFIILQLINIKTECQSAAEIHGNQISDSLALKDIIMQVISTHPNVKEAEEAISNANARIGLARTGKNPDVDISGSFANLGPVTKISIPELGSFQLYPAFNYSAGVDYHQNIYDFGRTRQNIEIENGNKELGEQTLEQVKQKLSLFTVNSYYTLLFLQAAIKIKEEQVGTLKEHLSQVEKMMATGSATKYQILATKVKISTVESQEVDLVAALTAQQAVLNSLTGNDNNTSPVVKNELSAEPPVIPSDSLLSYAFHNRDEVILNQKRSGIAELRYGMAKLQNKPMLSLQASAGAKNGYLPDLARFTPNYVVGLGIRMPILDGSRNRFIIAQAQSAITSIGYESEFTKRNISNELSEAEAYMFAAKKKVSQFELQLSQALEANSLAETSFKSGIITNLDLLDANTSVSESRLLLLKARIDYVASIYKLKAALGERIY